MDGFKTGLISRRHMIARVLPVVLVAGAVTACAGSTTKESTGEYVDDSVITTKVKSKILQDDHLKVLQINVETFKGVVQLSGFVNSQADINKAVEITREVPGVKSVKNDMRTK